ncbi:HNH endonuclease [Anoxybacillus flavithermus]|nr:RNA-guided endonuclease IscB [Anoxybacillus flavithermus]MBE2912936.1 HNH endonuclease [Anoxybacillus flavithermus]MBE2920843.1 HNH endonuclease [Anoxybacillus flavithermus]MBE2926273.1 HNH endonuclease [Anoxybacillus flavithermus]MBE2932294.1 HNH endonuclease [Anoxybacillus flavithermus]MBE2937274.1 HNH endonuclease [Anoxybacillus flavithermus]
MFVYVINKHGNPLMPCSPRKARILLKNKKAKVVKRTPFTIQLLYGSSGYKQPISLGVDTGTKHVGLSATTKNQVLLEAEVQLRTDIQELLATRRQFRRSRRNRNTRYRKARFLNRKKPNGWLAPSIQHKVDSHIKLVKWVHSLLPITHITVEVAQFDTQKIKNPDIQGAAYQQGEQLGFWNVREYVLYRDGHTCQWCKGKSKDPVLNVHHIESRKTGGDSPSNLMTLCKTCHDMIHREGLEHEIQRRFSSLKDASHMTVMRWFIWNGLKKVYPHANITYGYITKCIRIANGLPKSHMVDARCISGNPLAKPSGTVYFLKFVRKNNRQLHKATILKGGKRKSNKAPRFVKGFQLFDKVVYEGKECFIFGRRSSGYFDLRLLDGTKVHASASWKKLKRVEYASTLLIERRKGDSSPTFALA